ncbi:ABC transporter permease [Pseudobacteroides cellulosolvens]|uniref:ABC-2 family transporter protein n=1 Tax=Pseudobacteroides cellulosolvens ATCC 35603 = DSM 2933 TaxID=398512 RepID=A0A0L6JJA9_9FIRM|nr:ABC transporter permease [Pseudobacteroides cellulosolvens]KNY25961.1 hypothetical protein Bccel_1221 [Pseudobacteroides cellulosolvens ATCC 35603 = DSM 2933]
MYNLIYADLYKMFKSSIVKVLFGITLSCAVAMAVIAYLISQGKIDPGMSGIGFMFSDINIISILGAVIISITICGDFDNKIIHDAVASGCSRISIVVSKAIAAFCAIVFILLPYAIITFIALNTGLKFSIGSIGLGFLNIVTQESGISFNMQEAFKLLTVMLTLFIVYIAQLSLCVPMAFLFKKSVVVVAVYYGLTIFCPQLARIEMLKIIFSCTPYLGDYTLLTTNTATEDIIKAILVSMVFIIAMLTVTWSVFRKSEIK